MKKFAVGMHLAAGAFGTLVVLEAHISLGHLLVFGAVSAVGWYVTSRLPKPTRPPEETLAHCAVFGIAWLATGFAACAALLAITGRCPSELTQVALVLVAQAIAWQGVLHTLWPQPAPVVAVHKPRSSHTLRKANPRPTPIEIIYLPLKERQR